MTTEQNDSGVVHNVTINQAPIVDSKLPAVNTTPVRGLEVPCQAEDIIIPRAKLFQGLPTEYEKYPDARPGQIINTATLGVLPEFFIPVIRNIEWIRFNARNPNDAGYDSNFQPGELMWRSSNPLDDRVQTEGAWGSDGEKPLATKFLSFLSYFPGVDMPIMLSFTKTSYNAGKVVNTPLQFSQREPWNFKFKLTSKMTKSNNYSYYVLVATPAGSSSEDERKVCEGLYEQFKTKSMQVDAQQVHEDWQE